jgi:MFS family permease
VGPIVGGWLVDTVSWRVIFLINVPIAMTAGILASKYVREYVGKFSQPLDWLGAVLATPALGVLAWSLTEATGGGLPAPILVWASLVGLLLLLAFVWRERRLAEAALMPLTLFASSTFVGLTLLTLLVYGSLGGLLVLLPFFLIRIAHWTAIAAGAALLPVPILIGLGSRSMGRVAARYGGRLPLTLGAVLVGVGLALYARIDTSSVSYWLDVFPATCLVALGMAMTAAPLTTSVMESVDTGHVGIASGFNSAVARIGGLVATALLGYLFARQGSTVEFIHGVKLAAGFGCASALLAALCAYTLLRTPAIRYQQVSSAFVESHDSPRSAHAALAAAAKQRV